MFDERKHPRDADGKFTDGNSGNDRADKLATAVKKYSDTPKEDLESMGLSSSDVVTVKLDSEVQKQLSQAQTPKERQKIAFRYIMDNLRGKYTAPDGRTVALERVGASKITSVDRKDKLRACPSLADMIKAGKYDHSAKGEDKQNRRFEDFVYYRVRVKLGGEIYSGILNVGVRKDGSSTLYDLRPFDKLEDK